MNLLLNIPKKSKEFLNKRTVFVALILLVNSLIILYLMVEAYGYTVSNGIVGRLASTSLSVSTSSNQSITSRNLTGTSTARTNVTVDRVNISTLEPEEFNNRTTNQPTATIVNVSQQSLKTGNNPSNQTGRTRISDLAPTSLPQTTSLSQNISMLFTNNTVKSGLMELMTIFDKVMTEHNLTYFIYGGTMIGSYRHHGMVPWDDDLDVIVPQNLKGRLRKTFTKVSKGYVLNYAPNCFGKFFPSGRSRIDQYAWSYPFLDIFFYVENTTHIWDSCPAFRQRFCYPKSIVFPLRRRPFEKLSLLAPRDTRAVIAKTYSLGECTSNTYNHSMEYTIKGITVQCSTLHSLHPFVMRTNVNGGCNETLVYQGQITNVFYESGVSC